MKIYIAGPMTGYKDFNFPAFFKAEKWFENQGFEVVNPARLDDGDTTKEWEYYLKRDIGLLAGCDEIALLEGWDSSKGATLEALVAYQLGLGVMAERGEGTAKAWRHTERAYIANNINLSLISPKKTGVILSEAQSLVHGDRQSDYGHPYHDFSRTAQMWSAILGQEVTPAQVGLCMIAVKVSRECHKPKRDNLVDIAGYAETVRMVREYES